MFDSFYCVRCGAALFVCCVRLPRDVHVTTFGFPFHHTRLPAPRGDPRCYRSFGSFLLDSARSSFLDCPTYAIYTVDPTFPVCYVATHFLPLPHRTFLAPRFTYLRLPQPGPGPTDLPPLPSHLPTLPLRLLHYPHTPHHLRSFLHDLPHHVPLPVYAFLIYTRPRCTGPCSLLLMTLRYVYLPILRTHLHFTTLRLIAVGFPTLLPERSLGPGPPRVADFSTFGWSTLLVICQRCLRYSTFTHVLDFVTRSYVTWHSSTSARYHTTARLRCPCSVAHDFIVCSFDVRFDLRCVPITVISGVGLISLLLMNCPLFDVDLLFTFWSTDCALGTHYLLFTFPHNFRHSLRFRRLHCPIYHTILFVTLSRYLPPTTG